MAKVKKDWKVSKQIEMGVFINLKTDFGFKKIFGNKKLLISFLNALSILPEEIADIEYLPPEQFGLSEKNHKAIYDLHVKTTSGKYFIIEMQIAPQIHFAERMLFYASHLIVSQAPKGMMKKTDKKGKETETAWDYSLNSVYAIAILDFVAFKGKEAKDTVVQHTTLQSKPSNITFCDK
ncbi:MAG: Rpn family recombination-promoting nuclease/putative transposase, partial [Prevotellaceae bacterium]|nr:Rpn family recombination-promoting nuclease/putative transposase [Prevotellaceae bacterium]